LKLRYFRNVYGQISLRRGLKARRLALAIDYFVIIAGRYLAKETSAPCLLGHWLAPLDETTRVQASSTSRESIGGGSIVLLYL
jgi:hypothetical protein